MKTIAIVNQKGGVGKTTIAVNVSACLTMRNKRVLLVDADTQHSSLDWYSVRDPDYCDFDILAMPKGQLAKELKKPFFTENYDYIIIDGRPDVNNFVASIVKVSDIVVMPIVVCGLDVWATKPMVELCRPSKTPAKVLFNSNITGSKLAEEVTEALEATAIPTFDTIIDVRTTYRREIGIGRTVIHGGDKKAMKEIENLTTEILMEIKQ